MSARDPAAVAPTSRVSPRARALLDLDDESAPLPAPDPLIADLVEEFLEGRRIDATRIPALLTACDVEALERIGHNMRGCGASFGFPRVSWMGAALEVAAHDGDAEVIAEVGERLRRFLAHL